MSTCFFILVLCLFSGLCICLDLQQVISDLSQGGRKACPYCSYCRYRSNCPCSSQQCALCGFEGLCTTTCTGLCQIADPCVGKACSVNETCQEMSTGVANCVCKEGHVCSEDPTCVQKGKDGSCDFYTCFNDHRNCGSGGYALNYGRKYCNRFNDYKNQFTSDGQTMINCVRKCLTSTLIGSYQTNDTAGQYCDHIQAAAFGSHVRCYRECNFCQVWSHNKNALKNVYEFGDFFSREAISQVTLIGGECSISLAQDIAHWVSNLTQQITDIVG